MASDLARNSSRSPELKTEDAPPGDWVESGTIPLGLGSEIVPLPKQSRATEDRMGSDTPPDNVRLAGLDFLAVLEGRAAIIGPSHLPDSRMPLDPFHAKPGMKTLLIFGEIGDELSYRIAEFPLLLWT
ncbi:MAG TPA: hypothetical protein VFM51_01605 [Solirubrobacterales bacterium]|nr:hypothetical protein [Solirubrobacterales bacterium]